MIITLTIPRPPDTRTLQQVVEALEATAVQFSEEVVASEAALPYDFGAQFHWDESRTLLQSVPGKPMSQIVIDDRADRL